MFEKNNAVSRSAANDWVAAILENDLRSTKLAEQALKMTESFGKDSHRRVLAYKIGAMCGNVSIKALYSTFTELTNFTQDFARKEYVRVLRARREQIARDLHDIPDLRVVEWGRGLDMGRFVPKGIGKR